MILKKRLFIFIIIIINRWLTSLSESEVMFSPYWAWFRNGFKIRLVVSWTSLISLTVFSIRVCTSESCFIKCSSTGLHFDICNGKSSSLSANISSSNESIVFKDEHSIWCKIKIKIVNNSLRDYVKRKSDYPLSMHFLQKQFPNFPPTRHCAHCASPRATYDGASGSNFQILNFVWSNKLIKLFNILWFSYMRPSINYIRLFC